jgi:hypothetical protein
MQIDGHTTMQFEGTAATALDPPLLQRQCKNMLAFEDNEARSQKRSCVLSVSMPVVSYSMTRLRLESTPPPAAERQESFGGCADICRGCNSCAFSCVLPICHK